MTALSKKFEQIVKKELASTVLPVKTDEGILLGDVLISNEGTLKNITKKDTVRYTNIYLNSVAIKIAKLLMNNRQNIQADSLYALDQEYGKWLTDSLLLKAQYEKAKAKGDNDRADVFYARYIESRERTMSAKIRADNLAR
jgi:hypothetical protein